jgi:hypothetical protein
MFHGLRYPFLLTVFPLASSKEVPSDFVKYRTDFWPHRFSTSPPPWHRTRNYPRRGNEVMHGGSLYWVISGSMLARQRILDIVEDERDDPTPVTSFILDHRVVPLIGRPTRPFQGWRYLSAEAAPADLDESVMAMGEEMLPPVLRRELRALCLI